MTARIDLPDYALGSIMRNNLNLNFQEAFGPDYLVAWDLVNSEQAIITTVAYQTWTPVTYASFHAIGSVTQSAGKDEFTFPYYADRASGSNSTGTWIGNNTVAWDNTKAGLQAHTRKMKVQIGYDGGWFDGQTFSIPFNPSQLSSPIYTGTSFDGSSEQASFHQVMTQFNHPDTAGHTYKFRVMVWHNAKVAGAGVSLGMKRVSFLAPLLMIARKRNTEDS